MVVDRDVRKESESPYLIRKLLENRYNSWFLEKEDRGSRIEDPGSSREQ